MAVTLKDVAEMAGVSRSAVSRTFTEGASVSDKVRLKVMEASAILGFHPNALASSLTTGRTKLIGVVSDNFHNPIFLEVFDLITKGLQERGLRTLLVNLSDEVDPANSVRMLRQYSVDGVIVASSTLPVSFAEAFQTAGVPVVHLFGRHSVQPKVHTVGIDNFAAGQMAAQTLIARGYDTIGFMGGPETATSTQDRYAGCLSELRAHPNVAHIVTYAKAYSFAAGRAEMLWLIAAGPAQAYFCGDDVLSIGALSAAETAGLSVPNQIGFIGLNDMEMAHWANINLTTIHNPIKQVVASSVELVVAMLLNPTQRPEAVLFLGRVVERGTLRPLNS
jgi:DNA-binding LacI/PurR family transcriptional regulator